MSADEREYPSEEVQRRRLTVAGVLSLVLVAIAVVVIGAVAGAPQGAASGAASTTNPNGDATSAGADAAPRPAPSEAIAPAAVDTFDKTAGSIDDPASIWVVVNKLRPLNPQDYEPVDLVDVPVAHTWEPMMRQEASDAAAAMFQAATDEADLYLASNSAFRSYSTQVELYGDGSDPTTAPPGASEHQTGLAIDIGAENGCTFECLEDSPEGEWLRANAYRFGFLLRYPADKVDVTGYPHEAWHYRYIGVDLATEMHDTGFTTLEEFFGLPSVPLDQ
ncbi:D-Ala-D-Ala carboxypeptidase. Metallo peptidase. MEROPS family M15B [Agromyces sp. CF514]|uniref:M15 family metallopeptidase n=1 Tax=Agromyces sp. CF514 TaxID=1881031 RepID=UPI0008EDC07C|nr:M15 family metallopeptidase [Agromyces sp. CF514]SFR68676.1 D-Ala-D-Ala carboxypeptidase. Metallo peptidase. MEROPS family M15B [Agromyces sp. CF514]